MAIDAATIDTTAIARPVTRERTPEKAASPIINDGHNSRGVEIRGEMTFGDFLDIINPLQHIPIVGSIYREITGDTIKPSSKVIGGILYGGPIGGMASIANAVVQEAQGKDFGDQIMASLGFGGGDHTAPDPAAKTAVAANSQDGAAQAVPVGMQAAQAGAQAAALTAAMADKPGRLSASALPPADASALAAAKAAGASGTTQTAGLAAGRDGLAGMPHPSRMPSRDTPLANSMMARQAVPRYAAPLPGGTPMNAQMNAQMNAHPAKARPTAAASPDAANAAGGGTGGGAGAAAAANGPRLEIQDGAASNTMTPVSPDMLSETMMRNLAKYEANRKAAQSAAPAVRVSS